jgi:hypothetical protein
MILAHPTSTTRRTARAAQHRASPQFAVEIPELDEAAIERLADVLVSMLDQLQHDERLAGGEVPPENPE